MLTLYLSLIDTQEEKDTFEYIYNKNKKQLLYLAYRYVHNQYDAEDIVHNVFLSVAKNLSIFEGKKDSSIYSYLVCATKGHAQNFNRKRANENKVINQFYTQKEMNLSYTIENKVDCDLLIEKIIDVIKELDDLYSNVLYLYFVEDLSCNQIARLLDRKPATVQKQISRGKQLLYSKLKERGITTNER